MVSKTYAVLATTYYIEGKITVVDGMCSSEGAAKAMCKTLNAEYKKKREADKLLPKVVWTYTEV